MAIEAGASIVIVGEHPDNGKFYTIGEVRQDGWILTTDNHLFHHQFFKICSPLEPRPKASKIPKRAKRSTNPNSFLGESESPIFLGENLGQNDRISEISPKKNPSGSLYVFIQDKKDRYDNVKTYPKVEGERSTGNSDHWFWAYCWDEKVNGKWKTFKRSVPREKLSKVRMAIDANQPVSEILKIIG
ncbi:MAG: hypothetical protein O9352_24355 [Rhizobium sp.]|nr:hypothetical protein [Rhizobium sp.]